MDHSEFFSLCNTLFTDFHVKDMAGIEVNLQGLGPFNWPVRRMLRAMLRRHLRPYLEKEGRDLLEMELKNSQLNWEGEQTYLGLLG